MFTIKNIGDINLNTDGNLVFNPWSDKLLIEFIWFDFICIVKEIFEQNGGSGWSKVILDTERKRILI
jgi:hypothetical protein